MYKGNDGIMNYLPVKSTNILKKAKKKRSKFVGVPFVSKQGIALFVFPCSLKLKRLNSWFTLNKVKT